MTTLENQGRPLKEEGSKVLVEVSGGWDILVKVFSREGFPSSLASSCLWSGLSGELSLEINL